MKTDMTIEIGRRLKAIREYRLMTQKELADALNYPQTMISQYERGKRNISIGLLMKFCEALKVDLGCFDPRRDFLGFEHKNCKNLLLPSEVCASKTE